MTKLSTLTLAEASGREYTFNVYPFNTKFAEVAAVYAVTKRYQRSDGVWAHDVDYVGQTGNLLERFDDHHKAGCFRRRGANCICIHRDDSETSRLADQRANQCPLIAQADVAALHRVQCRARIVLLWLATWWRHRGNWVLPESILRSSWKRPSGRRRGKRTHAL